MQVQHPSHGLTLKYFQLCQNLENQFELKDQNDTTRIKYQFQERIGKGNFSHVYKVKDIQSGEGKYYAAKIQLNYRFKNIHNQQQRNYKLQLHKSQPINIQKCNNLHVIKCLQIYEDQNFRILILEYCKDGNLSDYHKRRIRPLQNVIQKQKQAIRAIYQIIDGLAELHRQNMTHRDLKHQNILVHDQTIKIIDLGFSKILANQNQTTKTLIGTSITMAPQILLSLLNNSSYTKKVDVWSIGILLYYLLYGFYPFKIPQIHPQQKQKFEIQCISIKMQIQQKLQTILQQFKKTYSPILTNFMKHLLCVNPDNRYSWEEVLKDPVFEIIS